MNSTLLQIAAKYLKFIFLTFAILALIQGHNHPGGGFIGGLIAALTAVYNSMAFTAHTVERQLKIKPEHYMGMGLICTLLSLLPSVLSGTPLMKGSWISFNSSIIGTIKLGTPLLFDIGVFFTVIGVTLMFLFTLSINE
jgi:multicomponent Na+:H+ antiporter subunit B